MVSSLENLNPTSLSQILGISIGGLKRINRIAPKLYYAKFIQKKDKKLRKLEIPSSNLKNLQTIILRNILYRLELHHSLFGGPGTSTKKAAMPHVRKPLLITTDLKDFFPSVKAHHVRNMLLQYGASEETADTLTRLVTHNNHLPQGAPTSPAIGRLVLRPFAEELEKILCNIRKASFSVYVDDIILSGPRGIKGFLSTIRKILARHGFKLNNRTKVMYKNEEQVCLNIRVNDGISPPRAYVEEIKELAKIVPTSDPRLRGKKAYVDFLKK